MTKILIVEDDQSINNLLEELLKKEGFTVINAYRVEEALLLLEKHKFNLIILDLMLPKTNGEELIKKIKNIPIIVLSAKISEEDKVNCLTLGANDYITKPFNNKELIARIKVQLRLNKNNLIEETTEYKELKLLNDNRTLLINKTKINLTKTEYAILKVLIKNQTQIVTKNRILELISGITEDCDENSLKVHISNIRKKIKTVIDKNYIESVWGIGFKMID